MIPTCTGCGGPAADGMSLHDGGVACQSCDTGKLWSEGYNDGWQAAHEARNNAHEQARAKLEAQIEQLREALEASEGKCESEFQRGQFEADRESQQRLSATERKARKQANALGELRESLTAAQGQTKDLEGQIEVLRANASDYKHRADVAEQELAAHVASAAQISGELDERDLTIERQRVELEQYRCAVGERSTRVEQLERELTLARAALEEARAEPTAVVPASTSPPHLIHPGVERRIQRWARGLGAPLSEYDLDALDRALRGE